MPDAPRFAHLVLGSTGEYSDHTKWVVAAYETAEGAEQHAKLANAFVRQEPRRGEDGDFIGDYDHRLELEESNPYDPDCRINYTGTEYVVVKIPLVRHVDEFLEHHPRGG